MLEGTDIVSCCPELLYGAGGYHDARALSALIASSARYHDRFDVLSLLYGSEPVSRTAPHLASEDPFSAVIRDCYGNIESGFSHLPASYLVKISRAFLFKNKLYLAGDDGSPLPVYENFRSGERGDLDQDLAEMANAHRIRVEGNAKYLFVGSAGSFNYGHFIVDDFPKFAASRCMEMRPATKIVMTSFPGRIDAVRSEGAAFFVPSPSDVIILDRTTCYEFDTIHYVTPSSYHPVMKSRAALSFTRQFLLDRSQAIKPGSVDGPIYIGRHPHETRRLLNESDLLTSLDPCGVRRFDVSNRTLLEQVAAFRDARGVIGVMGAAMTNQLFLPDGGYAVHLAPTGWIEPFYWDLSARMGQHYGAAYGAISEEEPIPNYQKSFTVIEKDVLSLVRTVTAADLATN